MLGGIEIPFDRPHGLEENVEERGEYWTGSAGRKDQCETEEQLHH